jgi:hypothetical protein
MVRRLSELDPTTLRLQTIMPSPPRDHTSAPEAYRAGVPSPVPSVLNA